MKPEDIQVVMAQCAPEKPAEEPTSTRDAVETAIDTSKSDKSGTWESNGYKKITRWKSKEETPPQPQQ